MTKRCKHKDASFKNAYYPNTIICMDCQSVWEFKPGMLPSEFIKFPLAVRRLILARQTAGFVIDNYADMED